MSVAASFHPILRRIFGDDRPVAITFWDGSRLGPKSASASVVVRSPNVLRRLLYAPNELGLSRAYVAGEVDIDGDIFEVLSRRDMVDDQGDAKLDLRPRGWLKLLRVAGLSALGLPLRPPAEEARLKGRIHSRKRDAQAISHHYGQPNEFYRLFLGPTMTYSCAYFESIEDPLDDAQSNKYELICRKLGLGSGMRLLDVGCGWGGMVLYAARHHGVEALGITISQNQADYASKAIAEAGLSSRCQVRLQDYRDVDGTFDAVSSIGMFEHVGLARLSEYFQALSSRLRPGGRLLNHAIARLNDGAAIARDSFVGRYVFPDGELVEVGKVVSAMHGVGVEVRDVESLREHYALTLRRWVSNLEANWADAVRLAGESRAKIWRLYMAGSALGFERGQISVCQVLGVKQSEGSSGMPMTRGAVLGSFR